MEETTQAVCAPYDECSLETAADLEQAIDFYWPRTEQERRDFLLARLIQQKKREMFRAMDYQARKERRLEEEILNNEVEQLLPEQRRKREYFDDEFYDDVDIDTIDLLKQEIEEAELDIHHMQKWTDQAHNMIMTEKYRSVPAVVFDHVLEDGEEEEILSD